MKKRASLQVVIVAQLKMHFGHRDRIWIRKLF